MTEPHAPAYPCSLGAGLTKREYMAIEFMKVLMPQANERGLLDLRHLAVHAADLLIEHLNEDPNAWMGNP